MEGLYKVHYNSIFENIKPEYLPLIRLIRTKIQDRYTNQDNNNPTEKFWNEKAYVRLKKSITLNFSLYLFSVLLSDNRFGYLNKSDKKTLLDSIYSKMRSTNNFDISSYFNEHFWLALQNASLRYIRKKYNDSNSTSDELRKELDREEFMREYNNYCTDKASEMPFQPQIIIG